jgi:hypothetical protein
VVFGAGGKTGNGALIEVANAVGPDGPPPYCIGVDTDQWRDVVEAHPCLVSSAMKLLDIGVTDLIKAIVDEEIEPGNFYGEAGMAEFHDFDSVVPDEVKAELTEVAAGLLSGEISTGYGVAAPTTSLDADALINERCTVCHTRERIDAKKASGADRAAWEETVDRMIGRGAQLSPEEREAVLSFLAGE